MASKNPGVTVSLFWPRLGVTDSPSPSRIMDVPVIPHILHVLNLQLDAGEEHCELVAFDILQQQEAKIPFQALNRSHLPAFSFHRRRQLNAQISRLQCWLGGLGDRSVDR